MKGGPNRLFPNARRTELHHSAQGFSLLELLFVVIIVVIMTAMAIPLLSNVTGYFRLRGAVSSVTGVIQSTRYQAIFQGCPYEVVFDNAAGTYQVKTQQVGTTCPGGAFANFCTSGAAACPVPLSGSSTPITLNAPLTLIFSPGGKVTSPSFPAGGINLNLTYGTKPPEIITVSTYGSIHVTP
ncbi:MAG TPA: prepilin-type N-terminal cleavage/methylation domain-containing protein [Candidatus Angelobacter sp.]|nr:prepilin-type N-terminal cleavage/methylation domain-containing protein [Candidatus Angelobacter sp.]